MTTEPSSTPIRWLHLSDFHVGMDKYAQKKLFKEIIQDVGQCIEESGPPDLIFITGDVAHSGIPEQYVEFASEFLAPLQRLLGAHAKERILIVPGNHDIDLTQNKYFDRSAICEAGSHFFDPDEEGFRDRVVVLPRFDAYRTNGEITPQNWLNNEKGSYGQVVEIRDSKLGVVGINTAWLCKGDKNDRHRLSPGVNILEDALSRLGECDIKIVLGHHPIDWFHDDHVSPIRAALAKHSALYLHGHLHRDRVSPEDEAGNGFLTVQSGAAFQTRARDTMWVNGFLWAELDLKNSQLRLRPREWNPDNLEWRPGRDLPELRRVPNTDWWAFPLPRVQAARLPTFEKDLVYPIGWQPLDQRFLNLRRETLEMHEAIRFFDGATPEWRVTLSRQIPRLKIVSRALSKLIDNVRSDLPHIVLLIGPAGEGKSTALMQITDELLQAKEWKVLWRTHDGPLGRLRDELLQLPKTDKPWLLVCDAAYDVAKDIFNVCQVLTREERNDFRFLLASRDTDWKAAGAHKFEWPVCSNFQQEAVGGLVEEDAHDLVDCWSSFGNEALGHLAGSDLDSRTRALLRAAHDEAQVQEGTLLGALLKVRYGDDLKEHVKILMNRLAERSLPGSGMDLLSAFSYIAIMHAEGLNHISKPLLAEALGCQIQDIIPHVLLPLGREAATSSHGSFVLTRHKAIAQAVSQLLPDVFEEDVETKFVELALAAQRLANRGEQVGDSQFWMHGLVGHLFSSGNRELAIRIASALLEQNPHNGTLLTHLSRLLRKSSAYADAARLFRSRQGIRGRPVFHEWGVAVSEAGELGFGTFLMALSGADQIHAKSPRLKDVKLLLFSLVHNLETAYDNYLDEVLRVGRAAAARLALIVVTDSAQRDRLFRLLQQSGEDASSEPSIDDELKRMQEAVTKLLTLDPSPDYMGHKQSFGRLEFRKLRELLNNTLKANRTGRRPLTTPKDLDVDASGRDNFMETVGQTTTHKKFEGEDKPRSLLMRLRSLVSSVHAVFARFIR